MLSLVKKLIASLFQFFLLLLVLGQSENLKTFFDRNNNNVVGVLPRNSCMDTVFRCLAS